MPHTHADVQPISQHVSMDSAEYVSTPIAESLDPYTLAYTILLLKEGLFGKMPHADAVAQHLRVCVCGCDLESWLCFLVWNHARTKPVCEKPADMKPTVSVQHVHAP